MNHDAKACVADVGSMNGVENASHSLNSDSLWLSIRVTWCGRKGGGGRAQVYCGLQVLEAGYASTCTDTSYKSSDFWDFF